MSAQPQTIPPEPNSGGIMNLTFLVSSYAIGNLLGDLRKRFGGYRLIENWQQGEFHYDLVLEVPGSGMLPGNILVIATNCVGGVKEVFCLDYVPTRYALWKFRCPDINEFTGAMPRILGYARTRNWVDPKGLIGDDAPSEIKPEFRNRVRGGGYAMKTLSGLTAEELRKMG